jgi:hypothetical protein
MSAARTIVVVVGAAVALLGACSDDETTPMVDAGIADAASPSACDPIGVCGDSEEPACQGCAIAGPCADAWTACQADATSACDGLAGCYLACPLDDTACYDECDAATSAEVVALLGQLLDCVFCQQCPESCRVDTSQCP